MEVVVAVLSKPDEDRSTLVKITKGQYAFFQWLRRRGYIANGITLEWAQIINPDDGD